MTRRAVFNDAGVLDDGAGTLGTALPDPSGEPDGKWLTTASGAAIWADTPAAGVSSVFGRAGAVVAVNADYYGIVAAALTGATQAARFVGATASGAPASGTFLKGDVVVDQTGLIWVCTVAGSPGTWANAARVRASRHWRSPVLRRSRGL